MGYVNQGQGNRPFDSNFCFFIQDFQTNDCLLVNVGRETIRGIVVATNKRLNLVVWSDVDDVIRESVLDSIKFLGPPQGGWLK